MLPKNLYDEFCCLWPAKLAFVTNPSPKEMTYHLLANPVYGSWTILHAGDQVVDYSFSRSGKLYLRIRTPMLETE